MDQQTVEKLKQLLLTEKARLQSELANFAHRNPKAAEAKLEVDFQDIGNEEGDNAAEVAQFTDNLSLEDELEKALRDTEGALKLIEKGEYGICKYCRQPIDERRLLARPTSTSCIQCKKTLTQEV
jgi:RNA polymerase-binding protein DksA